MYLQDFVTFAKPRRADRAPRAKGRGLYDRRVLPVKAELDTFLVTGLCAEWISRRQSVCPLSDPQNSRSCCGFCGRATTGEAISNQSVPPRPVSSSLTSVRPRRRRADSADM